MLDALKQLEDCHPESVRDHLDGVERWIGLAVLDAAQVGLIETALFAEDNLTHSRGEPEFSHAFAESLSQVDFHNQNYVGYALIHITTNSYKSTCHRC